MNFVRNDEGLNNKELKEVATQTITVLRDLVGRLNNKELKV